MEVAAFSVFELTSQARREKLKAEIRQAAHAGDEPLGAFMDMLAQQAHRSFYGEKQATVLSDTAAVKET